MEECILVFARREDLFSQFKKKSLELDQRKKTFILVKPGSIYRQLGESIYQINPQVKSDYRMLLTDLKKKCRNITRIIHLWNYESSNLDYIYHGEITRFLAALRRNTDFGMEAMDYLTKAMALLGYSNKICIYYFSYGIKENLQPQNIMVQDRYLYLPEEQSQYPFYFINFPRRLSDKSQFVESVLKEISMDREKRIESIQYSEDGARENFFLYPHTDSKVKMTIESSGVYLIVNDKEDHGWNLGVELTEKFKCRVVVIGEAEKSEEKIAAISKINCDGSQIIYEQADIAVYEEVKQIFRRAKDQFLRITGVIYHLDGRDDEAYNHNVNGVLIVDDITAEIPFAFYFVVGAAARPSAYDCIHAVSRSYRFSSGFTALRHNLVQQGKRFGLCYSFQWDSGDMTHMSSMLDRFSQFVDIEWENTAAATKNNAEQIQLTNESVKENLYHLIIRGFSKLISQTLKIDEKEISLSFPISLDSPTGLHFDSISLTTLAEKIKAQFDINITPVIFFQHKNLGSLVDYLYARYMNNFFEYFKFQLEMQNDELTGEKPDTVSECVVGRVESIVEKGQEEIVGLRDELTATQGWKWLNEKADIGRSEINNDNAVAIIGASGIFPGSSDLETFWNNLELGNDLISEIPRSRWDWREYYGDPYKEINKTNSKWGGFINGIDQFDPAFFGITEKEALLMDPRQRLFLETVWKTIEDAGYRMSDLSGSKTAVFVGAGSSQYHELLKVHHREIEAQSSTANSNSILANRISYLFNFTGPSEAADAACASSLVAIHKAVEQIIIGECELAIAGGVNIILTPELHISYSKGGVLAVDGKCRAFDKNAGGYVRSEGVGAVLLKPLKKAIKDNDHIYAVIRGSAVNHGGRSNSMTSPSPDAQEEVLAAAYRKAKIAPLTVNYIEAHGTATNLGDSIEVMALKNVFARQGERLEEVPVQPYCGIGSVKTNIGHTEETAGIAGIFKVIMGMKYKKIPATLHCNELNPYINLDSSPFYIVNKTKKWDKLQDKNGAYIARRAGISAFGFGGVNAHVILEEYEKEPGAIRLDSYIIVLSAENQPTLKRSVVCLLEFLENSCNQSDLMADIAFTLQVGREEMKERLALVVSNMTDLKIKLKQYVTGVAGISQVYTGFCEFAKDKKSNKPGEQEKNQELIRNKKYDDVAGLWVTGVNVEWKLLYYSHKPARISLPTYPFDNRSYWCVNFEEKEESGELSQQQQVKLNKGDQEKIMNWNQTVAEYPKNKCVYELIEEQVIQRPDEIAVTFENKALTYRQLWDAVEELAEYLCLKGLTDETYVGIFVSRSMDMLVSVLAVLKAGGTYIPLDPVFPKDRIQYIINDTKLKFVITQSWNGEKLPDFEGQLIVLDKDRERMIGEVRPYLHDRVWRKNEQKAQQVAYVIYTSGSTGNPKGVQIFHKSLMNFLCSMLLKPGMNENDYLLAVTTLCFDIAGLELLLPLIVGGKVEILPESVTRDGVKLKEKIEKSGATAMQATPATWQMLLAAGWTGSKGFRAFCGGEALSQELAERLLDSCEEVWNLYGPTETTIWSTISRVRRGEKVNIGRPIANTKVYILDEQHSLVPVGMPGELCIGGEGLAKGYLNNPELTAKKFIKNPFVEGDYIYCTGDQACFNENGEISFSGRIDNQVKLRGYRIELEEIEICFYDVSEVERAVVVVRKEKSGQENLVAFYTLKEGAAEPTQQTLIGLLGKRLPEYMIPPYFILLRSFPMTLNLKIDRKALSNMDLEQLLDTYGEKNTGVVAERENPCVLSSGQFDSEQQEMLAAALEQEICSIVAQLSKKDIRTIESNIKLGDYGFNSILFTSLAIAVNEKFSTDLTAVIFFKYSTVSGITTYLLDNYSGKIQQVYDALLEEHEEYLKKQNYSLKNVAKDKDEPIAIIGMYGKMPQSPDLNSFWENLIHNKNMVTEIPKERWDYQEYFGDPHKESNKTNSKWGGFITDVDCFDAEFFNISRREAELMDPRQRLLIEAVWKTFEDSGYKATDFSGTKTGIFIGAISSDYWDVIKGVNVSADGYTLSGSANCIIPNRISYMFNLRGPSEAVDTACSSSLTALDRAVAVLKNGDCDMAIAGGVNLILSPHLYLALSKNGMLSPDGKCKAFDKAANGYVRGEGVGTILLKPLNKALKDGDHIYAIIKSTAVNHGGRASSLTAPNPQAQAELIVEAYTKAGVAPSTVTYIETHGTGTKLGDPIEVEGLKSGFAALGEQEQCFQQKHCGLGAIKTNIGHLEAAAGIAGVLKVVLSMQAGVIPANIHFDELNPYVNLEDSNLYLINENRKWERLLDEYNREIPRRAGISSFGFGGANAHVVLEEYIAEKTPVSSDANVIVLSAKNQERLVDYAKVFVEFIDTLNQQENGQAASVTEIACTLQNGRNPMEERLAVVVNNVQELQRKLISFIHKETGNAIYTGNSSTGHTFLDEIFTGETGQEYFRILIRERELNKLAKLWACGVNIDWRQLYPNGMPRRISLPTYPFSRERYWVSGQATMPSLIEGNSNLQTLSPLLDSNESNIDELCYKKQWNAGDIFIREHVVRGERILPAVVYLEMARMAGSFANKKASVRKLKNLVWLRAIEVENSKEIYINLYPKDDMVEFSVNSRDETANKRIVHAQGRIMYDIGTLKAGRDEYIDIEAIRQRCPQQRMHDEFYQQFYELGYQYGPAFKSIRELHYNESEAIAQIGICQYLEEGFHDFLLHPSIMEGVLQTLAGLLFKKGNQSNISFLPFSLGELEIIHPFSKTCYSYIEVSGGMQKPDYNLRYNITLADETGLVLAKLKDYYVRPIQGSKEFAKLDQASRNVEPVFYSPKLKIAELEEIKKNLQGPVIIFDYDEQLMNYVQQQLKSSQQEDPPVILVKPGGHFHRSDTNVYLINPSEYSNYQELFSNVVNDYSLPSGIIHNWSKDVFGYETDSLKSQLVYGAYSLFYLCKAMAKRKMETEIPLLCLYQSQEDASQPLFEALKGMVRSVKLENSKLNCRLIEFKRPFRQENTFSHIMSELCAVENKDWFATYRDGNRFVESFERVYCPITEIECSALHKEGVYLITGGTGTLGLIFAQYLVKSNMAKIVLAGRSNLSHEQEAVLQEMEKCGTEILYIKADISKYEDVEFLAQEIRSHCGKLNGIIHCAGEIRDEIILKKEIEDFKAVLAAKVFGTVYLDKVFSAEELDFFVVFSSISSVLGNIGQTDYAFANSFLDAFSSYRDSLCRKGLRSGKSLAMNWSLWKDGGMQVADEVRTFITNYFGISLMEINTGLTAFVAGLGSDYHQLVVLENDSKKVKQLLSITSPESTQFDNDLKQSNSTRTVSTNDVYDKVKSEVVNMVSKILKLDIEKIDLNRDMNSYGFDSISFTELSNHINEIYQCDLTPAMFFELNTPTVASLVLLINTKYQKQIETHYSENLKQSNAVFSDTSAVVETDNENMKAIRLWRRDENSFTKETPIIHEPVAIIGINGIMPQSEDLEEFWNHLEAQRDLITEIPQDRFDWRNYYGDPLNGINKTNSKWGGFMKEIDKFDPLFFGISPREAELMDPQHRIFLEVVWKTIEDAGYRPGDLSGTNTGVYVGITNRDYNDVLAENMKEIEPQSVFGNTHPFLPNRVSFLLNLHGPSEPIDTLCSSSLVAIHRAVEDIRHGHCEMAIVGGVSAIVSPRMNIAFSKGKMLSDDGHSKTFDKSANGFVRGEGAGAILLKPLSKALADRDHIYAVIKGTAENHGGHSHSLTAPNAQAQAQVIMAAYESGNISPDTISYIEAHGTGTVLGDPVEINGLKIAFETMSNKQGIPLSSRPYCGIGSVKTNIGHLEAAAGIAGILKVILAMKYKKLPASIKLSELNPYIDLKGSPFYIVDSTRKWECLVDENGKAIPRIAGVSSFGAGGSNSHIVLEEYVGELLNPKEFGSRPQILTLSAKSEDSLKAYSKSMQAFLETHNTTGIDLDRIAYTLQVGREPMEERLAIVVNSLEDLKEKLGAFCRDEEYISGVFKGNTHCCRDSQEDEKYAELIKDTIGSKNMEKLAQLWAEGIDVEWDLLYCGSIPERISLPTYPFARERYWVELDEQTSRSEEQHPLLHKNTSTLKEARFSSVFSGNEFFVADHVVGGKKIIPGVAYIEMAKVAGEFAGEKAIHKIENLVWVRPLAIEKNPADVNISFRQDDGKLEFAVDSVKNTQQMIHAQGEVVYCDAADIKPNTKIVDVQSIKARCSNVREKDDIYNDFVTRGFTYGAFFQPVQQLCLNEKEGLGYLKLHPQHIRDFHKYNLHPSLLDGALQIAVELLASHETVTNESHMPFSMAELEIVNPISEEECYVYATFSTGYIPRMQVVKFNITVMDKTGRLLVTIKDFTIRSLKSNHNDEKRGIGFYKGNWAEQVLGESGDLGITGNVLVFEKNETISQCLKRNYGPGSRIIIVNEGQSYQRVNEDTYTINPKQKEDYEQLVRSLQLEDIVPETIIHAWSLERLEFDKALLPENLNTSFFSLLYLTQAFMKQHFTGKANLIYIYHSSKEAGIPEFAAVSALFKTLQQENVNFNCKTITMDKHSLMDYPDILTRELLQGFNSEISYQNGKRYCKRFSEIHVKDALVAETRMRKNGTYLITGGAGGLGLIFSEYLAENYKANLVLAGRSELNTQQMNRIKKMESFGSQVIYIKKDIAKQEDVEQLVSEAKLKFGSINGVIHAAGVIKDSFLIRKAAKEAKAVIDPKIYGTLYLDEALKNEKLDFFVLFSSVSSIMGNLGQCDYAYGNRFMDGYAILRENWRNSGRRYGKTLSVNWPIWECGGMEVSEETKMWMKETMGIIPLAAVDGIKALEVGLSIADSQIIVMKGSGEKMRNLVNANFSLDPLEQENQEKKEACIVPKACDEESELYKGIIQYLKEILSMVAKIPIGRIKANVPLEKYGIDSLMVLNLNRKLEQDLGKLSKTLFFEYQTLEELGRYFIENHKGIITSIIRTADQKTAMDRDDSLNKSQAGQEEIYTITNVPPKEEMGKDIAIVGLSGKYSMANTLEEFWDNLKAGKDCITEIPDSRWEHRKYYDPNRNQIGTAYSKWGSFIDDVDKFDPLFFNISPKEAEYIDPQERLFLSSVWHALEDAGYTREGLSKNKVGVFVGVMYGQYQLFHRNVNGHALYGDAFYSSIANRVSYFFNFRGPSIALDTMCSSSATAIHLACESIYRGESQLAIAGGVNISIHPNKYTYLSRTKFAASDGRCRSFGDGGDGYVPGEGVGAVLLKPLKKAVEDGDHIYGIIKGISINHGGKTNGYTVPNPKAQTSAILDAIKSSGVNPRTISYIEAHGTGTALGDPIEITGMTKAFSQFSTDKQYCSIGSIKSNIGHLEAAAAIAGLTKVLLQMKHKKLVPSIHSNILNSNIDFGNSPFYVQNGLAEWHRPVIMEDGKNRSYPRVAGISAFGAGGSNAHIVIQEYEEVKPQTLPQQHGQQIFVLSAKNKECLGIYAKNMLGFLQKNKTDVLYLSDIVFTLQVGREAMNERLSIVTEDFDDLLAKLEWFCNGGKDIRGLFRGNLKKDRERVDAVVASEDEESILEQMMKEGAYFKLAELWAYGADINWQLLYDQTNIPRRLSLPTYPFMKERCWISDTGTRLYEQDEPYAGEVKKLHSLLDSNISTLKEEKFLTHFTGTEYYLSDHIINGQKILPGAVSLEMARAAGGFAGVGKVRKIRDIFWSSSVIVDNQSLQVYTSLLPAGDYVEYEITSDKGGNKVRNSYGKLLFEEKASVSTEISAEQNLDIHVIRTRCTNQKDNRAIYDEFKEKGIEYGRYFNVIDVLHYSEKEALSHIKILPSEEFEELILHPQVLDGTFQTAAAILGGSAETVFVPYSIGEVDIRNALSGQEFYAYVYRIENATEESETKRVNVAICDKTGQVLVAIKDLLFKEKKGAESFDSGKIIYLSKVWEKTDASRNDMVELQQTSLLIIANDSQLYDALIAKMRLENKDTSQIILVTPGSSYCKSSSCIYEMDMNNSQDYKRLLSDLNDNSIIPEKMIHFLSRDSFQCDGDILQSQLRESIYSVFYLTQAIMEMKFEDRIQLLYIYEAKENEIQPQYAGISGFLKSAAKENRKFTGKTVGITTAQELVNPQRLLEYIMTECKTDDDEVVIDYTTGERFVAGFTEMEPKVNVDAQQLRLRPNGVYLITGGMGGLGFVFAEYLAKQVKAQLILVGRSDLNQDKLDKLKKLEQLGSKAVYLQGDILKKEDMEYIVAAGKLKFKEINGVIHSAGVVRDSLILNKKWEDVEQVLSPKVYGSVILDELTRQEKLDFFVLFSSITGAMGNFGQSDYAYGNSFMDYFAGRRERLRLNGLRYGQTVSINWPLWAEGGMRVDQQTRKMLTKTMGTDVLDTKSGLKAFEFALQTNCNQLLVAKGNPEYIKEKMGLVRQEVRKIDAGIVTEENKERIIQNIENELAKFISEVLKIQEKDLEMDENFNNFGFDSISITEITNLINERFNLEITPANFYEHATVQAFSENLYKENTEAFIQFYNGIVGQGNEDKKVICVKRDDENYEIHQNRQTRFYSEKSAPVEKTKGKESVAIIGMSGRMAQSEDLKMFWEHLRQGNDLITEIPKDRWDWQDYYGDAQEGGSKTTVKWGGFIEDIDKFDAELFGISPHEAKLMDPQQRIFLETVWRTIEDAGYKVSDFSETKTGVFVGVSNMDYYELLNEVQEEVQAHITTGNAHSIIANRISFLLNTHGPSEPINTACSSSLVAIHRAVEVIRSGSCDMAIAGGVNAIISPKLHVAFDKAGMLSLNGCCRTFDKSANGYARGEGVGAVLLKSLSKAEADGDHIYAVIRGSAINHCGRTNSLTAPNPNAQADVIIEAIEDAKVDPANITYIEAHGTGTSLGDPIEINGLKKAFSELFRRRGAPLPKRPYCTIGSVKTNIGHLESAAGIAGIFKAVLAMKYGQIPKNVHFKELNPYIDLKESPFYIAEKTKDWEVLKDKEGHEIPRVCGVSSFGFGGVNAHVILEDYRTDSEGKSTSSASDSQLFILSAKSHEMLRQYAKNILGELNHLANTVNCEKDKDIIFVNMQNALLDIVAGCLQVKRSELSAREELTDYGFDQVALIGLANAINERYGTDIEYDTLLAYPSIEVLIPHLYDRYQEMFTVQNENAVFKTDKSSAAGISIANLCYTLQVGREPMKSRIAAVVTDLKELMKKLNLYLEGRQDISEFYSNETGNNGFATDLLFNGKEGKEYLNSLMKGKQATKFAQLWTYGANIDWNALYDSGARQRISLQAYPFARKSFWVPIKKQRVTLPGKQSVKTIANQPELKSQLGNGKEEKDKVRDILASVLSLAAEEIDENAEFMSIGLDSIFGIKLIKELKKEFGFDINPLVVIENPTIRQLANHIIFARDNKNNFQSEQVAAVKEELTDKNSPAAGVKDRLAGILAEILSLATGGIDGEAEFSALGLDSILAIKLTKRLNKEFSFEINPVKIIENPTLNRLSKAVSAELSE